MNINQLISNFEQYTEMDNSIHSFILTDNSTVRMRNRAMLMHIMLWHPYIKYNLSITQNDIYFPGLGEEIDVTAKNIAVIQSKQYIRMLAELTHIPYPELVYSFGETISKLWNFNFDHCRAYGSSLSASKMYNLMDHPKMKPIVEHKFHTKSDVAEAENTTLMDSMMSILTDKNVIKNNPLYTFLRVHSLNLMQLPQLLIGYGPRSDLDDTIMKHIISNSAMQGLNGVKDYATESLSAKKASFMSHNTIRDTQYGARKIKLLCSCLHTIFPGDCGSKLKSQIILKKEHKKAYLMNNIFIKDKRVLLTENNIDEYTGQLIYMRDPAGCKHKYGFCEACAGVNDGVVLPYYPINFNPGNEAGGVVGGVVTQQVLSTKHLLKTSSVTYNLPDSISKYLVQSGDIYISKQLEKYQSQYSLKLPLNTLGALSELRLTNLPSAHTYSTIKHIEIIRHGSKADTNLFNMTVDDKYYPYLSEAMLIYIGKMYNKCVIDRRFITIPLNKWDPEEPIFKFTVVSDDMVSFVKSISSFVSDKIASYTSYNNALTAYTNLLYQKTNVNIYHVKIILKALMVVDPIYDFDTPIVTDLDNVHFAKLRDCITNRSISTKFGYQEFKSYLSDPRNLDTPKVANIHEAYFGLPT